MSASVNLPLHHKRKGKERKSIYVAPFCTKRSGMDHTVSPANNTMPAFQSRSSLLVPPHPGGPGKRAVKRLWCGGVVVWLCVAGHSPQLLDLREQSPIFYDTGKFDLCSGRKLGI